MVLMVLMMLTMMLMMVTWSMSIWLPMLRWEMLEATTGCHSKSGTPCKHRVMNEDEHGDAVDDNDEDTVGDGHRLWIKSYGMSKTPLCPAPVRTISAVLLQFLGESILTLTSPILILGAPSLAKLVKSWIKRWENFRSSLFRGRNRPCQVSQSSLVMKCVKNTNVFKSFSQTATWSKMMMMMMLKMHLKNRKKIGEVIPIGDTIVAV